MKLRTVFLMMGLVALVLLTACGKTESPTGSAVADVARETVNEMSCADSDGGIDEFQRGILTATLADGTEIENDDKCMMGLLSENYCDGSFAETRNIRCQRGCRNGACIR